MVSDLLSFAVYTVAFALAEAESSFVLSAEKYAHHRRETHILL